jgi:hypothetical protein
VRIDACSRSSASGDLQALERWRGRGLTMTIEERPSKAAIAFLKDFCAKTGLISEDLQGDCAQGFLLHAPPFIATGSGSLRTGSPRASQRKNRSRVDPANALTARTCVLPGDERGETSAADRRQPSPTPARRAPSVKSAGFGTVQRGRSGPGGWWLIQDVDVEFGVRHSRPDISSWRRDGVPDFPAERPVRHRPDWLCEGLSPRTALHDKATSARSTSAPSQYWLVDPPIERSAFSGWCRQVRRGRVAGTRNGCLPPF